jgi:SAM-dependent methyltransferase
LKVRFVRGDARRTGFRDRCFDSVLVLGSSFGYFVEDRENRRILAEAGRILVDGGRLLLDLPDAEFVVKNFCPETTHKVDDDISVQRRRELGKGLICCRERVFSKNDGLVRENTYCTRLYGRREISSLLTAAGFSEIGFLSDFMRRDGQGDFGTMTNRMVTVARRA